MKLCVLRVCASSKPRQRPVEKRAQRNLSLVRESVCQADRQV